MCVHVCAPLSLLLYIYAVILVTKAMYAAKFILLWVCFAPWADRKSQIVKDCEISATSFPQCFARWPGVKRHSPEAAFDT